MSAKQAPDPQPRVETEARAERRRLRGFGLTVGLAFVILAAFLLWKTRPTWPLFGGLGALLVLLGLVVPALLRPVERLWMKLARALGWVMTRVILGLIFLLLFTPAGLALRLLGKDPLELRLDRRASSYWRPRTDQDRSPARMERMF